MFVLYAVKHLSAEENTLIKNIQAELKPLNTIVLIPV